MCTILDDFDVVELVVYNWDDAEFYKLNYIWSIFFIYRCVFTGGSKIKSDLSAIHIFYDSVW